MGAERAESRRHLELDSTMSSSKKIYSMHPNVVAGEHGQHHARIADSYRLSILLTHIMSYRACVLCRVRRRRTRRVRRRGPAPRDDARIGAVWPPGYGVRLVSDTAAVLRTGDCTATPPGRGPCVPDGSHGHAVGPWRRAGVAVPHLALISLEAASRSSRRVKTVVSSV